MNNSDVYDPLIERQLIDDYLRELAALDRRFMGKSKLLDRYMNEAGDVRLELIDHPDLSEDEDS